MRNKNFVSDNFLLPSRSETHVESEYYIHWFFQAKKGRDIIIAFRDVGGDLLHFPFAKT